MRSLTSVLYGLFGYAAMLATLLALVAFSGNLYLPRSVDVGGPSTLPEALGRDLLLLALFGVQHSVMARRGFKRWWSAFVPEPVERSTFMLATCAVLWTMFVFWMPIGEPTVWRIESPAGVAAMRALFGLGWLIVLVSTYLIDHFELFGLRQSGLLPRAPAEARLRTPLFYRWVRHPLYLGFLVTFWSTPVMTAGHLLYAAGFSGYILIGIAFEERDLLREFGERYRVYRLHVGMLLPRLRRASLRARRLR